VYRTIGEFPIVKELRKRVVSNSLRVKRKNCCKKFFEIVA
jgi:hypothetical protein